ncbi:hypothetical protein ACQYAD_10605 [Neobacillus sp. SM06]|uniref:hypothetical protein n=1 Tax=Neobacillus sp. SM06 TaxID=3422492 RepID=UPI003D2DDADF
MKQIIQFDNPLRDKIHFFEIKLEKICADLRQAYQAKFEKSGKRLVIELIRNQNRKNAHQIDVFADKYESFIEIGIEIGTEYYPNGYIPIWKVKTEWFQKIGYLSNHSEVEIQHMIHSMVVEMLEDQI